MNLYTVDTLIEETGETLQINVVGKNVNDAWAYVDEYYAKEREIVKITRTVKNVEIAQ